MTQESIHPAVLLTKTVPGLESMKVSEEIAAFAFRIKKAIREEVGDHECWDRDNFIERYPTLLSIDTVLRVIDRCMA